MTRYLIPHITVFYSFCLVVLLLFASGCSMTRGLEEGQRYYSGAEIEIKDKNKISNIPNLENDLKLIPVKGTTFGLFNIYLGLHNIYQETEETGFKHWVKYTLGKEPVIFEENMIDVLEARLDYYLKGKGLFNSEVVCDSISEDTKAKIYCEVTLGERSTIDSLIFPVDSTYAALKLDEFTRRIIIKEGVYYDRDRLAYERARLVRIARDNGFADFSDDDILFYVDTAYAKKKVNVYLEILQPADSSRHIRYSLDRINVYTNHAIESRDTMSAKGREIGENLYVYESEKYMDDWLIRRMINEKTNEFYSQSNERRTINRILDLGLFSFVNVRNVIDGNGKQNGMVQNIFLTPEKMQSISGEVELNNRSGNFFGTGLSLIYTHRNIFGGGENLRTSLSGQVEAQFGDELGFLNSTDVSANSELSFPRFIVPFMTIQEGSRYIPRTVINGNVTIQRRTQYYTLQSGLLKYGFRWRETARKSHNLYPLVFNVVRVRDISDEFLQILNSDRRLARSFEDVSIIGLQYSFIYNNQGGRSDNEYRFFRGEVESSGNLIGLVLGGTPEDPGKIFGETFAQFLKITADYRRYYNVGNGQLALRALVGSGFSYGHSTELPYIKQYLIGGSNSVRAFRLRGLGPGTFVQDPDSADNPFINQFLDQTGDIKLELNMEFRFPIFSYLKGAWFLEGGNIWLMADEDTPQGNFTFADFYKEIGIGTGIGFRLDFEFFLIRLDMAFPLRAPIYQQGFKWVGDQFDLFNSTWRKKYLRYNLGIGYPF